MYEAFKEQASEAVKKLMGATDKVICEAKAEVAREIFEGIEKVILDNTYPDFNREHKPVSVWKATTGYDAFYELKKKYTETEETEETEETHFAPEDVRKMTPIEVKNNYKAIVDSMKEWK